MMELDDKQENDFPCPPPSLDPVERQFRRDNWPIAETAQIAIKLELIPVHD
jgi:hypothetical protein